MALFLHRKTFCALVLVCALALSVSADEVQVDDYVECRHDSAIAHVAGGSDFMRRSAISGLRLKDGPATKRRGKRSIARCRGIVESVAVDEAATSYLGVPIGGVVSIVESMTPWGENPDAEMTPICSGIFVGQDKVLSSAHCVYHQRRNEKEDRFWLFGGSSRRRRYFYAITGKTSHADPSIGIYPLQTACIPSSYVNANNETITSGQINDLTIFTTLAPFRGDPASIATFVDSLPANSERREYMLPQYPLDVASGAQLVIDVATSPLYKTSYFGGIFYSIDLVSWIGSSGGAIIDVAKSAEKSRPVLAGILMSEGWQVCDSGMLPVTKGSDMLTNLIAVPPLRTPENPAVGAKMTVDSSNDTKLEAQTAESLPSPSKKINTFVAESGASDPPPSNSPQIDPAPSDPPPVSPPSSDPPPASSISFSSFNPPPSAPASPSPVSDNQSSTGPPPLVSNGDESSAILTAMNIALSEAREPVVPSDAMLVPSPFVTEQIIAEQALQLSIRTN